jgi:hypothetical protein
MVNQYMSAAEAESRSPYASNPTTSGYGGRSSNQQQQSQNRQQQQQQQRQNPNQQHVSTAHWDQARHEWVSGPATETSNFRNAGYDPLDYERQNGQQLTYQQQAEQLATQRAGYTDPNALGDINTQRRAGVLAQQGMSYNAAIGVVLNQQYQEAQKTPGVRDDIYFLTEGDKWKENIVERGSAYHNLGQDLGTQIPANPYEYQADLAVEAMKGSPEKRSEWFSPVSGEMSGYQKPMKYQGWERDAKNDQVQQRYAGGVLPGGQGSQEVGWDIAKSGRVNPADFTNTVAYLNAAEGKYGPYGQLYGGDKWMQANPKTPSETIRMQGIRLTEQQATDIDWAASAGKQQASALFQAQDEKANQNNLPAGVFATGTIGRIEPGKAEEPRALSFGGVIKDFTQSFEQLKKGDVLSGIGLYSQGISRYSTRAVMPNAEGFGEYVESEAQKNGPSPMGSVVSGVAYVGETIYSDIRKDPVQDVALSMLPLGFKAGESLLSRGIARAATSGKPIVSGAGRVFSTPAAKTWGAVAKTGMVGVYAFQSGASIYSAPNTPKGKGEAIGTVGYQLGMMGLGIPLASQYTPTVRANPFESRTFFSGERKLPLSEKVMIKAGDFVTGLTKTKSQRVIIKSVSAEYNQNLFQKPEITNVEPNYADLTHVGPKNAAAVKVAMVDQVSVGYGSGMMDAQVGKTPAGAVLRKTALPSSDVDVFAEFPKIMETKAGKAAIGMDVHTFPEGYPDVGQGSNAPVDAGSYLFGARYRVNPYIDEITVAGKTKGYTGETSFEHLNVQFRKLSSAVRDDVLDPMNKGYRLGKDVSRLTRVRDVLAEIKDTKDSAFDNMLKQEITYNAQVGKTGKPNVITETLGEARARYEGSPKQNIPETFSRYTKGAVSSIVSAVAPSSFIASLSKSASASSFSKSPSSTYRPSIPSSAPAPRTPYTPTSLRIPPSPSSPPPSSPKFPGTPSARSPPSSTPYISPYVTPSSPPRSPPSSPPSSVPYTVPYVPPYKPPFGGFPSGIEGSSGDRPYLNRGEYRWSNLNPVADIPYLSKGLGDPFSGGGSGSMGGFGAKCRHTNAKLKKKCSRFLRNG